MEEEWICSVDPGSKNFSFGVEVFDTSMLSKLSYPPKNKRFIEKGKKTKRGENLEPSEEYVDFLEKFWHCGRTVHTSVSDITNGVKGKGKTILTNQDLVRLSELLDSHIELFDKCTTFVIEKQMAFKGVRNPVAIKVADFVMSYFLIKYKNSKKVVEHTAYLKTQLLGCPGGLDKPKRKKWATEKADEIWSYRGDMNTVDMVGSIKKKDDVSDCLLLSLSYIISDRF